MNDKFKKGLLTLALICTPFTMVACGNNEGGGDAGNTGGGTSQESSAEQAQKNLNNNSFNTLKTVQKTASDPQTYKDGFQVTSIQSSVVSMVASKAKNPNVAQETLDALNTAYAEMAKTNNNTTKYTSAYDKANERGYYIYSNVDNSTATPTEKLNQYDVYLKENDKYFKYSYSAPSSEGEVATKEKHETLNSYWVALTDEIADCMDTVGDFTGFKDYDAMEKGIGKLVMENMNEEGIPTENLTTNVKVTETNGDYKISIKLSVKMDTYKLDESMSMTGVTATSNIDITFNEKMIKVGKMNYKLKGSVNMPLGESTTETVAVDSLMENIMEFEITNTFDETKMPNLDDKTTYVDAGMIEVPVNYFIDGKNYNYQSGKAGSELTHPSIKNIANGETVVWYTDPDCTKVANFTTFPAYGLKLYTKTPKLQEGYAWVASDNLYVSEYTNGIDTSNFTKDDVTKEFVESLINNGYYFYYTIENTSVSGTANSSLVYVNGTIYENGASYTLDPNKVNIVIKITMANGK